MNKDAIIIYISITIAIKSSGNNLAKNQPTNKTLNPKIQMLLENF